MVSLRPLPMTILPGSLLVGVPAIDGEHLELVALVDRLTFDMNRPDREGELSEGFTRLGQKLKKHFDNEEAIIESSEMPVDEMAWHFLAHEEILEQYANFNYSVMTGDRSFRDASEAVQNWVTRHIAEYDMKIRGYISRS